MPAWVGRVLQPSPPSSTNLNKGNDMPWPKSKWRRGEYFAGIHALIDWLEQERPVYYHGIWKHHTILQNMSLTTLRGAVRSRRVQRAFHGSDSPIPGKLALYCERCGKDVGHCEGHNMDVSRVAINSGPALPAPGDPILFESGKRLIAERGGLPDAEFPEVDEAPGVWFPGNPDEEEV